MSSQAGAGAGTPESGLGDLAGLAAMSGLPAIGSLPNVRVRDGREVIFTMPRRYRWPLVQRGAIFGVIAAVGLIPAAQGTIVALASWFAGPVALGYLVTYVWRGRFRTSVIPDGIQVRGYITHFVRWQEITAIEVRSYGPDQPVGETFASADRRRRGLVATSGKMARLAAAYVVRHRGRALLLRAPLVANWQHDPYFEAKINVVQGLMARYTGVPISG